MRRQNLLLITGALLLLAGLAMWLLRGGEHGRDAAAVLGRATPTADAPAFRAGSQAGDAVTPNALPATAEPAAVDGPTLPATAPPATVAAEDDSVEAVVRGRVVDHLGTPIAGAAVVYWPNDVTLPVYGLDVRSSDNALEVLPRTITNASGFFEVRARHRTQVKNRFVTEDPLIVVVSGDLAVRAHMCKAFAGGELDIGDIALEPGTRLTGRVVDEAGRPVAGARVQPWNPQGSTLHDLVDKQTDWAFCHPPNPFTVAISGEDGRFATGALWDGSVQFGVNADGFLEVWRERMPVKVGESNDVGDIALNRGVGLSGTVRDADGKPVPDARVVCWEATTYESHSRGAPGSDRLMERLHLDSDTSARTDAAGRFFVPNLPVANHCLCVDAPGFEPLIVEDLLPGGAEPDLTLVRAATLSLTVLDAATHTPVSAARVSARRFSGEPYDLEGSELPIHAGEGAGRFVIERLGLVRTTVTVSAPGCATTGIVLEGVVPPAAVERTLELPREATLSGRVTADDGAPLADAPVEAKRDADSPAGPEQKTATDAQGRFAFVGLPSGEWALTADARDYAFVERKVTVAVGQQLTGIDFVLPAAASVFGMCSREDGSPDEGHVVQFRWMDPALAGSDEPNERRETREMRESREALQEPAAKCNTQGRYELRDLQPGTWRVLGKPSAEITLAPGERRELNLRESPAARITGRLLLADGTPAHDGWVMGSVEMHPQNITIPTYAHVGEDGRYELLGRLGRHTLIGAGSGTEGGLSPPITIELHEGEQLVRDLRLGDLSVRGRVVEAGGGAPVPGAQVFAMLQLEGAEFLGTSSIGAGGRIWTFGATSDAEGRFELAHLAPGLYALGVDAAGARAEEQAPVLLAPGTVPEVELRLVRTGSVMGVARNAAGVPVKSYTYVNADGPDQHHDVTSIEGGRFEFTGLVPGAWQLTISKDDIVIAAQSVVVAPGQTAEVELIVP